MINEITHVSLIVVDQDKALKFFVEKLGFIKADDNLMGKGQRWLTVKCSSQSKTELILQAPDWGIDGMSAAERRAKIGKQSGFCFASDNIQADYRKLKEKKVEVLGAPEPMPWGTQMLFKDLYGNTHLLVQPIK